MKISIRNSVSLAQQVGYSIVELMVAILIGLIILAGVVQVVITSKTTFLAQEEMSYIQENARYALDVISKDIQSAGYWGCAGTAPGVAVVAKLPGDSTSSQADAEALLGVYGGALTSGVSGVSGDGYLFATQPITGFSSGFPADSTETWTITTDGGGTDTPEAFIVRSAGGPAYPLQSQANTSLNIGAHDLDAGDYVAIVAEDCRRVGVIKTSAVTATSSISYGSGSVCGNRVKPMQDQSIRCDKGCNCDQSVAVNEVYMTGSTVYGYNAHGYFIGESSAIPGQPALKRMSLNNDSVDIDEIALGVEDMELRYGVDTSGNGVVDRYLPASAFTAANWEQWNNVKTVQISLVFRSQSNALPNAQTQNHLDNTYNDRFMRQEVTAIIKLRNRT